MFGWARTFLRDESGATAIEYGLIAALIAVAIIAAATNQNLRPYDDLSSTFQNDARERDGLQRSFRADC